MEKFIENLALTLAFFSRIPLPKTLGDKISHDAKLSHTAALFPVTGLIIALPIALVWYCASLFLPSMIAAGLAIATSLMITGGLHEDGLADCADGLGATPDRERALEIMRDSRIGTYGTLALIISVGLRWAALAAFTPLAGVFAILIANSGARTAMTLAMRYSNYARKEGLGKQADDMSQSAFLIGLTFAFSTAAILGWHFGVVALLLGFIVAWGFLKHLEKRLGGYTGDGLGGMEQLAEITILITLAGAWS